MKKKISVLLGCLYIAICSLFFVACDSAKNDVVRIHIRANSNESKDQEIKIKVKDKVVEFITPFLASCKNSNEVKMILQNKINDIENVSTKVLADNGFSYTASATIKNEYFPTRDYNGVTFSADYYDALIINLGTGVGNNWWCVAYPPLCFVGDDVSGEKIEYRSKLLEIIKSYFE